MATFRKLLAGVALSVLATGASAQDASKVTFDLLQVTYVAGDAFADVIDEGLSHLDCAQALATMPAPSHDTARNAIIAYECSPAPTSIDAALAPGATAELRLVATMESGEVVSILQARMASGKCGTYLGVPAPLPAGASRANYACSSSTGEAIDLP